MIAQDAVQTTRYMARLRWAYLALLVYGLLTNGAVEPTQLAVLAIGLSAVGMLSLAAPIDGRALRRIFGLGAVCLSVLLLFGATQGVRLDAPVREHPAWAILREQMVDAHGAVSVAPAQTLMSLTSLLPALAGLIALKLVNTQFQAIRMLQRLALLSGVVAAFGIVQHFLAPTSVLFERKVAYIGSLTSVFINRNTAGTFVGMSMLLNLALASFYLRAIDLGRALAEPTKLGLRREYLDFGLYIFLSFVSGVALFLTQSRGAVLASLVAAIALLLMLSTRRMTGASRTSSARSKRLLRYISVIVVLLLVISFFAERVTQRLEDEGVDQLRFCTYAATWRAALDNWPLGSGLGTFVQVFPAYRRADCNGIDGIWEAAHNTPLEAVLTFGAASLLVVPVLLLALKGLVRGLRDRHRYRYAPALGLALIVLLLSHSLLDFSLQIPAVSITAITILAACLTVSDGRGARDGEALR